MKETLKICLVSQEYPPDTAWGGIASYTYNLAHSLTKQGHLVHVITRSLTQVTYSLLDDGVAVHRVYQPTLSASIAIDQASYFHQVAYSQAVNDKLQQLHEIVNFDIVEFPDFGAESFQFAGNIPSVVRLHTPHAVVQHYNGLPMTRQDIMISTLERVAAEKATRLIAPTPAVSKAANQAWGTDLPMQLLPNPIRLDLVDVGEMSRLDSEVPRLLYFGRFEPLKGLPTLLEAMSLVVKERPDAKLTLIGRDTSYGPGGTSYLSELFRLMKRLGLGPDSVRVISQWQGKNMLYRHIMNSDVCVCPSEYDNFPYSVLEAFSCGKPVVMTRNTGISHYLEHGEEAMICETGAANEMADHILRLLQDVELRKEIARNTSRVIARFDADVVSREIAQMYREVIEEFDPSGKPLRSVVAPDEFADVSISLCVICFNAVEFTKRCVESIRRHTTVPYTIHLLDNGSSDETREYLLSLQNDSDVRVILSNANLGVPGGRNALIQGGGLRDYVLFMDNDVEVFEGWFVPFLRELKQNPRLGVLGVEGYRVQVQPPVRTAVHVAFGEEADIITGYTMFMRNDVVEAVGLFDENLGRYWHDDDDYSIRAIGAGYRNKMIAAPVFHYGSKSSSTEADMLKIEHSRDNQAYLTRKWVEMGIIDENGRPSQYRPNVVWEGSQLVYSSLAHVNREISLSLIESDDVHLSLIPYEVDQFGDEADPRFPELTKRLLDSLPVETDFHIRHQWPPNFEAPLFGKWILMQPWEFGSLPKSWLPPMRDEIDEIWCPSEFNRRSYIESGVPADKVHVIPNGANTELFRPDGEEFPLPTNKSFKFGFVGGSIWRKGVDLLLEAYVSTFTSEDDVVLVIKDHGIGTFYQGWNLSEQIREIQSRTNMPEIVYLNEDMSAEEIAALYRSFDCLVHPYRGEGFGMPILEALATAKPVLVTGYGAALDFCNETNAFLIPAEQCFFSQQAVDNLETVGYPYVAEPDLEAFCRLFRQAFETPQETLAQMGRNGRKTVLSRFTWQMAAEKIRQRLDALQEQPIARCGTMLSEREVNRWIGKAQYYERKRSDWAKALYYYQRAHATLPDNEFLLHKLAECHLQLNLPTHARALLERLGARYRQRYGDWTPCSPAAVTRKYGKFYNMLGLCAYYLGDGESAARHVSQALRLLPDDEDIAANARDLAAAL